MTRRALVIGSQAFGLTGVENDVTAMTALLREDFGFTSVAECRGSDATRDGILEAYERLIEETVPGDTVAFYYSGHGAYARNPRWQPGQRDRLQCLVPVDWSIGGEFRGILDSELSEKLGTLTEITHNVTVILDCCHAAQMSRDADANTPVPRALTQQWNDSIDEFLAKHPPDLTRISVTGNRLAVRMVAAEPDRSAYERDFMIGGVSVRRGTFTRAIESVLRDSNGAKLSWRAVNDRVREIVLGYVKDQRPAVEGPQDRLLFETEVRTHSDAIVYFEDNGKPSLRASRVLGAYDGAVYEIVPPAAPYDPAGVIATATVTSLEQSFARVKLADPTSPPPVGALAYPKKLPFPALPIFVDSSAPSALQDALGKDRFVERVPMDAARVVVSADGAGLHVRELGRDLFTPIPTDDHTLILSRLETLARGEGLRRLAPGGIPEQAITIEYGRVEGGKAIPHGPGDRFHVGEYLYTAVSNASNRELYVAIYDVGICGAVTLLVPANGIKLAAKERFVLGDNFGKLEGLGPFYWPRIIPEDGERRESLVIVYTDDLTDFSVLETTRGEAQGDNALDVLVAATTGTTRNVAPKGGQLYGVRRIDFDLSPWGRGAFAVDRSLDSAALTTALATTSRGMSALAGVAPGTNIAIRLLKLTIHDNRALWGRTAIRLDSLAITPGAGKRGYHAKTEVLPGMKDGDDAPIDRYMIYYGPVDQFLDFGLWVSRDQSDARSLEELMQNVAGDPSVATAITSVAALAIAAPHAAAFAAAATGVATLVNVASKLATTVAGTSIGLYRCSFLRSEGFGIGRHPVEGTVRAQDFSFAFSIEQV